ncbi:MAG: GIY-YIG nuclease family protein [Candidatus Lloydbacteria bacterium]|nr:GIY-YIG nuclease family protein [Candidatus Lloydbacteria bacterium]
MSLIYKKIKQKQILPDTPGVYRFLDARKKILYIGKATSLRDRVRSYFSSDIMSTRGPIIAEMLEQARDVRVVQTDSVLEALILEAALIKKHQPKYNSKEKSDKSFNYVVITDEDFPRVLITRERELLRGPLGGSTSKWGPFPQGSVLREALKIVRKIFPFRDICKTEQKKPCFNAQIGLCLGVCIGAISKKEYAKIIQNLKLFFEGKKRILIKKLEREMREAAKHRAFERAHEIKKTIFALKHIQDVSLIKNTSTLNFPYSAFKIEAYDVAHFGGVASVGVMTVVEGGETQKNEYRKFNIKSFEGVNDTRALTEILSRRLAHAEWLLPRLIVVDGGTAQVNAVKRVLVSAGVAIPVVGVVKDERHRPKKIIGDRVFAIRHEADILLANAEAHRFAISFHRKRRRQNI